MSFEFIKTLNESKIDEARLIKSKSKLEKLSAREVADLFYLHIVALEIIKQEFSTAPDAQQYASKTLRFQNFKRWQFGGTDIYMLAHALIGDSTDDYFQKDDDKVFLKRIFISEQELKNYFRRIAYNRLVFEQDRRFTLSLSYDLKISSIYRSLRRLAIEWPTLSRSHRELLVTRLLQAFRSKGIMSDLYPYLKQISDNQKLELKGVYNAETGKQDGVASTPNKSNELVKKLATGAAIAAGSYMGYKALKSMRT